ncbi:MULTISPECIES: hypothetical protein [unclassified Nostoc]|uniref:hypothetical protein n=1 Tax=unclassified Nostoc TaxID=2593658 RepID=UPI00262187A9|nr:hypothetical protein [Nostoc sp. S13]MDF5738686.1 hypothetical protein [Nostoc sp. S13]
MSKTVPSCEFQVAVLSEEVRFLIQHGLNPSYPLTALSTPEGHWLFTAPLPPVPILSSQNIDKAEDESTIT